MKRDDTPRPAFHGSAYSRLETDAEFLVRLKRAGWVSSWALLSDYTSVALDKIGEPHKIARKIIHEVVK